MNNLTQLTHLYLVRFMADVLQQQLHTAVITVSYKYVVLFICIPVTWRDTGNPKYRLIYENGALLLQSIVSWLLDSSETVHGTQRYTNSKLKE